MNNCEFIELTANIVTILGFVIGIGYVDKIYNKIKIIVREIKVFVGKIYIIKYINKNQIINVGYSEKDFQDEIYSKGEFWK